MCNVCLRSALDEVKETELKGGVRIAPPSRKVSMSALLKRSISGRHGGSRSETGAAAVLQGKRADSTRAAAVVAALGAVKAGYKNEQQQAQKEVSVQQLAKNPAVLSAAHFNILPVPLSFGPVSSYNASAVLAASGPKAQVK